MTGATRWPEVTLGSVATLHAGSSLPEGEPFDSQADGYLLARVSDMNRPGNESFLQTTQRWSASPGQKSATSPKGSLVIPKRGGAIGTNKKRITTRPTILDPNLMAIYPRVGQLDIRYLYHWFLTFDLATIANGSSVPQLNKKDLDPLPIPLPPLKEQLRIGTQLDATEALIAKRHVAIALLNRLVQSIFVEMFGDPDDNQLEWPELSFSQVLTKLPRNGLSPSTSGTVTAKVLTLSAVTGSYFDGSAFKIGTFKVPPPAHQSVSMDDFLVCRGNGNIDLVGRGFFPTEDMPDITFPDTIIASQVNLELVTREYLETIWTTRAVRRQIEASARTTNGTFKINQKSLEAIKIMVPPLERQRLFSERVATLSRVRERHAASSAALDELFASLQHRAFRREL